MAGLAELVAALGPTSLQGIGQAPDTPLNYVACIEFQKKNVSLNTSPPIYRIHPVREQYADPQGAGASGNPRLLHTRKVEFEVHSWGADVGATERLNQAFVTALREIVRGANYQLGGAEWVDPANAEFGPVLVLTVSINFGLAAATLPTAPPDPVTDATYAVATITQTAPDTTGLVPGIGQPFCGQTQ